MNKEQIFTHLEKAKTLSWDDLAYEIMCLDEELYHLTPEMSVEQVSDFKQMIGIYEMVKQDLLNKTSKPWKVQGFDSVYND